MVYKSIIASFLLVATFGYVHSFPVPLGELMNNLNIQNIDLQDLVAPSDTDLNKMIEMDEEMMEFMTKNLTALLESGMSRTDIARIVMQYLQEATVEVQDSEETVTSDSDLLQTDQLSTTEYYLLRILLRKMQLSREESSLSEVILMKLLQQQGGEEIDLPEDLLRAVLSSDTAPLARSGFRFQDFTSEELWNFVRYWIKYKANHAVFRFS